jgi:hypothetical protein
MYAVSRAAEGFDRRAFAVGEALRVQEAGIVPTLSESHIHALPKSTPDCELAPDSPRLGVEPRRVQEYGVVDAPNRRARRFDAPRVIRRGRRNERGPDEALAHPAPAGFSIRLSDY